MEKLENKRLFKIIFNYLPLIAILIFALTLRLWWLNKLPVGITYDEVEYILDAKAIYFTGKDISGSWSPLSLTTKPVGVLTAELPALMISPLIGPLELSLFTARLPYAVASVLIVFVLYLIAQELFSSKKVSLMTALLLSINPWSFHFGRTAFEAPVAILFYLMALYVFLKTHSWRILLSFPFLFLAFFAYLGTKILFFPLVLIICLFHYYWTNRRGSKIPYIVLLLLCGLLVFYYAFSLKSQPARARTGDLLFLATDRAAQMVNTERRLTIPNNFMILFSNKAVYFIKTFIENYLSAFSVKTLFLFGEARGAFSIWNHGMFYYPDLIFILIGLYGLFKLNRKAWWLLASLIAISPLPSALGIDYQSYVLRSALLYPFLTIMGAFGITYFIDVLPRFKRLAILGLVVAYSLLLSNYLYLYFFRYPVYGSEGFFFSGRVLSQYLSFYSQKSEKKIMVISPDSGGIFKQYLFFSGLYNRENAKEIAINLRRGKSEYKNVSFTDRCPQEGVFRNENLLLIYRCGFGCEKEIEKSIDLQPYPEEQSSGLILSISNPADGGEIYRIYGDEICSGHKLNSYPRVTSVDDFELEKQNAEKFCQKWIMDLTKIKTKAFQQ